MKQIINRLFIEFSTGYEKSTDTKIEFSTGYEKQEKPRPAGGLQQIPELGAAPQPAKHRPPA